METITSTEIAVLLGVSRSYLSTLRRSQSCAMPLPVNKDNKLFLYDRELTMKWIDQYLAERQEAPVKPGLDNEMARAFLIKPLYRLPIKD